MNDRPPQQQRKTVRFLPRFVLPRALAGFRLGPGRAAVLAALCLLLLLELPSFAMLDAWRPTGEATLLLCAFAASAWMSARGAYVLRVLLAVYTVVFLLTQIDRAVFLSFMGEEPLLYDQLFMLRHLFVLISDVLTARVVLGAVGVLLGLVLLLLIVRRLLRVLARGVASPPSAALIALLASIVALVTLCGQVPRLQPWVRFVTPGLIDNVARSHDIYLKVQHRLSSSPYRSFAELTLRRKPDVYLVFVESYGRLVFESPWMRRDWLRELKHIQQTLSAAGWSAVSGFSEAPVMGGRSWLAEGSVLMGMHVPYEAVFHHLVSQIDRVPNLVGFLAGHGYHTVQLAPSDRERPGVENVNYYHYQRVVRFPDLAYHGPRAGWGIVPDQYSLGYTDEHVLRALPRPLYFEFHMVTSHAPWEDVPELVDDYRTLSQDQQKSYDEYVGNSVWMRLERYAHARRFPYYGALKRNVGRRYLTAMHYELAVLTQYLAQLSGDALVIAIGDHQPPFLAAETRNFDTPVHVFARDPRLLDELAEHGFRSGLVLDSDQATTVRHEGLFSLLVRSLVRCCGDPAQLPNYRSHGVRIGR